MTLLQSDEELNIKNNKLTIIKEVTENSSKALYDSYYEYFTKNKKLNEKLQKQLLLPTINVEYFQGNNAGLSNSLNGFQVGLAVPILSGGYMAKTKAAQLESQSWEQEKQNLTILTENFWKQKQEEIKKYNEAIKYYDEYGKKLSKEIIKVANMSYKHGEIDFFQYITSTCFDGFTSSKSKSRDAA